VNKVWDLQIFNGYAKTVVLSCFQRGSRACGGGWFAIVIVYLRDDGALLRCVRPSKGHSFNSLDLNRN
jgi:hypothetical protein